MFLSLVNNMAYVFEVLIKNITQNLNTLSFDHDIIK